MSHIEPEEVKRTWKKRERRKVEIFVAPPIDPSRLNGWKVGDKGPMPEAIKQARRGSVEVLRNA